MSQKPKQQEQQEYELYSVPYLAIKALAIPVHKDDNDNQKELSPVLVRFKNLSQVSFNIEVLASGRRKYNIEFFIDEDLGKDKNPEITKPLNNTQVNIVT